MKKIFLTIGLLFTITSPIMAEEATILYTTTALNARELPSAKSEIISVVEEAEPVDVIYEGDTWNIVDIDGQLCYMYNKYLTEEKPEPKSVESTAEYSSNYFQQMGVIGWGGWRWTWYSQRVLPGGGLNIPGRHVGAGGYVMDENNRICLASSVLSRGTVVSTPFGAEGCVYDSGCASDVLDVYVDW